MAIAKYAITRQGYELLASLADAEGKTFKITCAKCSDKATEGELEEQTELVNVVRDLTIVEATSVSNTSKLRLRIDNKDIDEGFELYQLGVYAKAYDGTVDPNPENIGVLLQIWQFDVPEIIPSKSEAESFVKDYLVTTELATADNITINVDAAAYVTMPRFLELVETVDYIQSNENILINPDGIINRMTKRFIDTTTHLDFYYHKDMWYAKSVDGEDGAIFDFQTEYTPSFLAFIAETEKGMQFKNVSDTKGYFTLGQIVDFNIHRRETLQEKYLTLSFKAGSTGLVDLKVKFMIDDDVIDSKDIILNNAECETHSFTIYTPKFYNEDDTEKNNFRIEFEIGIESTENFYLANVKLERSKVATKYMMQDVDTVTRQCKAKYDYQEITIGGLQKLSGVVYRSLVKYDVTTSSQPSAQIYENITIDAATRELSFEEARKGFRYENAGTSLPETVNHNDYGLAAGADHCYVLISGAVAFKSLEYYLVVDCRPYL